MLPDVYRQAASIIVLRPHGEGYQLLLLHKPRKKDAWQVPQGGVESGETIEQAALRELMEEAGIRDARVIGQSEKVYQYDFPPSFRRFRPDNVCGQRIGYVFAVCPKDTKVTVDGNEINGHEWVNPAQIGQYIRRKEYLQLVQELYEEALAKTRG